MAASVTRRVDSFRRETFQCGPGPLEDDQPLPLPGCGQQFDMEVVFRPRPRRTFAIEFGADRIEWAEGRLNRKFDLPVASDGNVTLRVLVDRPLLEVLGNRGMLYAPFARREQGWDVSLRLVGDAEIAACRLAEVLADH